MTYFKDLEKIININSYSKNKAGVDKVSELMTTWLNQLGYENVVYKRELIGDHNLYSSKKTQGVKILLIGHNDTVFPENTFENFSEDEEWIYGPGVCDMKGGNIVALQSLRNLKNIYGEILNIDVLLVSDEEIGSEDSSCVLKEISSNYDICIDFEAAGEKDEIVVGRKGVGTFTLIIHGKAAHAGNKYQEGINANLEGAYKLQELVKLTNLEKGSTVNPGKIVGGIGANTISPKCEITVEIRYTNHEEKQRLLEGLNKIVNTSYVKGTTCELNGKIQRDVMEENKEQLELIELFENITNSKILTEKRGGVSDANIISNCGVITLDGFGPYGDGDHTIHERALKSSFEQRIEMTTKILSYYMNQLKGN